MNLGGLDHRARWRGDPAEALRRGEVGDRTRCGLALDDRVDGGEVRPKRVEIDVRRHGPERRDLALAQIRANPEVPARTAEQDDADVDELASLDARGDAEDRVLEGLTRHGACLPRSRPGRR